MLEFIEFLIEEVLHVVRPLLEPCLRLQLLCLWRRLVSSHLGLYVLNLLLQEVLALLLVEFVVGLLTYVVAYLYKLQLTVEMTQYHEHALLELIGFQHFQLSLHWEWHVACYKVDEKSVIVELLNSHCALVGYFLVGVDVFQGGLLEVLACLLKLNVLAIYIFLGRWFACCKQHHAKSLERRYSHLAEGLYDTGFHSSRHVNTLHHPGKHTNICHVVL